jgi:hypothetical protein
VPTHLTTLKRAKLPPLLTLDDGNRSSFRNVAFEKSSRGWKMPEAIVIFIATYASETFRFALECYVSWLSGH